MPSDVHDEATRRRNMQAIRGRNTRPEVAVRKALHARGFRYRLDRRDLPGTPDITLPRRNAVVFVHGCFWHGHDCQLFRWPATRTEFWRAKISRNIERDQRNESSLQEAGWRVAVVWECSIKGRGKIGLPEVIDRLSDWLKRSEPMIEIRGTM